MVGFRYAWRMAMLAVGMKKLEAIFVTLQLEHYRNGSYEQCEDLYERIGKVMADMRAMMEIPKHGRNTTRNRRAKEERP